MISAWTSTETTTSSSRTTTKALLRTLVQRITAEILVNY